ncbi:hypothetical protein ACM66Z_04950 [Sulfurovum sp. ST-21]|uniref:Uncharacterized protein n=1 Tax=Sulfurovum indicum TaxID=2779528 RepID=A0A7M1S5W1_9BACT|nr:hypothetical protein [Sulfurovum indicum]QOR62813.1 hypothetical protein IMZ28_04920 [Sulfurovum indicum]
MKLIAQIDMDCQQMDRYFHKLFIMLQEARADDKDAPIEVHDYDANFSQATYHSISHFIKPDMIMNIYSLIDFWMDKICEYQRKKKNLSLGSKDIKGKSELHARHKYLTAYANLNLSSVQDSYKRLDELRKVRNTFIHGGGHVPGDREREFSAITGIVLSGSLINIDDSFIWSTLEHAKKYLQTAILA